MIRISAVNTDQPTTIKKAIEEIARQAQALQKPSEGDKVYVDAVPGTADLAEGQEVYYLNGATIRKYTKLNGVIRFWALT